MPGSPSRSFTSSQSAACLSAFSQRSSRPALGTLPVMRSPASTLSRIDMDGNGFGF